MYNVVRDALTKLKYMASITKVWQQSGLGVKLNPPLTVVNYS